MKQELNTGISAQSIAKGIIEVIWDVWYGQHHGRMDTEQMAKLLETAKHSITSAIVNALDKDESHCVDCCCARSWKALGIDHYTGKSIAEHIAELRETPKPNPAEAYSNASQGE